MRPQSIYVSATPANWELEQTGGVFTEQVIRPTGLIDPPVEVRPASSQVDDLIDETRKVVAAGYRVLVTTLTKRMAEDLTEYMHEQGIRVRYMHSDVETLERIEIIRDLRLGAFDVLIGINLLARRPRHPRMRPGRHPRCRQGRLPALGDLAGADHRPRRAQRRRPRHPLCRRHHRLHGARHGRDQPPPREADGLEHRTRHHARKHQEEYRRHPRSPSTSATTCWSMPARASPKASRRPSATTSRASSPTWRSACVPPPPISSSRRRRACATRSSACARWSSRSPTIPWRASPSWSVQPPRSTSPGPTSRASTRWARITARCRSDGRSPLEVRQARHPRLQRQEPLDRQAGQPGAGSLALLCAAAAAELSAAIERRHRRRSSSSHLLLVLLRLLLLFVASLLALRHIALLGPAAARGCETSPGRPTLIPNRAVCHPPAPKSLCLPNLAPAEADEARHRALKGKSR